MPRGHLYLGATWYCNESCSTFCPIWNIAKFKKNLVEKTSNIDDANPFVRKRTNRHDRKSFLLIGAGCTAAEWMGIMYAERMLVPPLALAYCINQPLAKVWYDYTVTIAWPSSTEEQYGVNQWTTIPISLQENGERYSHKIASPNFRGFTSPSSLRFANMSSVSKTLEWPLRLDIAYPVSIRSELIGER